MCLICVFGNKKTLLPKRPAFADVFEMYFGSKKKLLPERPAFADVVDM